MEEPASELPLAEPGVNPPPSRSRRPLRPWTLVGAAGALLMIGAIGGMYIQGPVVRGFFKLTGLEPGGGAIRDPIAAAAPPPAEQKQIPRAGIVALGRLQPVGRVIEVAGPTTASAPRVLELRVKEGDVVQFDAPLVVLDTYPQLLAARDTAKRAVDVAEAALDVTQRDVGIGAKEGRAAVDAARVVASKAKSDLVRQEALYEKSVVALAELEAARSAAQQSAAELRRAEATAGRLGTPNVRLAEQNLEAARADLARAEVELRNGIVYAPSSGTVLSVHVRPGERAPSGILLTLADLSRMEAEIEVYQEAIPELSIGQPARLESPVLQTPLKGSIRRIGLEVGRQSLTSSDPAANTDARVVKAWVDIDAAHTAQASRFVGLEIIAHLEIPAKP